MANTEKSFEDYVVAVGEQLIEEPTWRPGQTAFNVLYDMRPDLSEQIRTTRLDPFYVDGEHPVLTEFYNWVGENW